MKKLLLFCAFLILGFRLSAQLNFINQDSVFASSRNCTGGVEVCIDSIVYEDIQNYRFYLDGNPYTPTSIPCRADTIHAYSYLVIFQDGETGPFRMNSWGIDGQNYSLTFPTLSVLTDSMRSWDPSGSWRYEPAAQIIFGYATGGRSYTCQDITGLTRGGRNEVCYNPGVVFTGMRFRVPVGVHEFVVEQLGTGTRDTVVLSAACVSPETITRTINTGFSDAFCVNISQLLGAPLTLTNVCAGSSRGFVTFDAPMGECLNFSGVVAGTDTACLVVCDGFRVCDTTYFIVTAEGNNRYRIIEDTITLGLSRQVCSLSSLSNIASMTNYCRDASGNEVTFDLATTNCVTYRGVGIGIDTACVRICDGTGTCDTVEFRITGLAPPAQPRLTVIEDTITVGGARQRCNLGSLSNITSFTNYCTDASGTNIRFALDTITRCVTYTGLTAGIDTACVQVCNASGICDTFVFRITGLAVPLPPRLTVFTDTITVGLNRTKCNLSTLSNITSFTNYCLGAGGTNVSFSLNTTTNCVTYNGITEGVDSACVRVCDALGTCDTVIFRITALPLPTQNGTTVIVRDTVTVGRTNVKCNLPFPVGTMSIDNICTLSSGTNVSYFVDLGTLCVDYMGLAAGIDTACLKACNNSGLCDTIKFIVTAVPVAVLQGRLLTDSLTVRVNEAKTYCPDTSRVNSQNMATQALFPGNFTYIHSVVAPIANNNPCVSVKGYVTGRDTLYRIICNANLCDTTKLIVIVSADTLRPTPRLDTLSVLVVDSLVYCNIDTTQILRGIDTVYNACPLPMGSATFSLVGNCVKIIGNTEGVSTACIVVGNRATNIFDTTTVRVTVRPRAVPRPTLKIDSVTLSTFQQQRYCLDTAELRGLQISSVTFCTRPILTATDITINNDTRCLNITGERAGRDTVCVLVCTTGGVCDTTILRIRVTADTILPTLSTDTVNINVGQSTIYCGVDTLQIRGSVDTMFNACPSFSGTNSDISIIRGLNCLNITGLTQGTERACIVVYNRTSRIYDTTIVIVNVRPNTSVVTASTDTIQIRLGEVRIWCRVDSSQIGNRIDSIFDACPGRHGFRANLALNRRTHCVTATGVGIGNDTMCVVAYNRTTGKYDTTYLVAIVRDTAAAVDTLVIANADNVASVLLGRSVTIRVYDNDTLRPRVPTRFRIVQQPRKGTADTISIREGIIRYEAGTTSEACGIDNFIYEVCVGTRCDTAIVTINNTCSDSLIAFNAFTPNGDGKNDFFVFEGISKYPQNTLCIFNRWGNEVARLQNYDNTWDGSFNGSLLPDGTYYYWLRDDATTTVVKVGFLQIYR